MNIEELRNAVQPILRDRDLGLTAYALTKDGEEYHPKKLDIESSATPALRQMFLDTLKHEVFGVPNVSVMPLSCADDRCNVIYEYDLDIPPELKAIGIVTVQDGTELLNIDESNLSTIKALIIEIGNNEGQLVVYKTMSPVNYFGRDRVFLKKHKHRLTRIDDEFLRISANFQMFQIGGALMVLNLQTLEKHFGFEEIVKREAKLGMTAIEELDVLENPDSLRELIDDMPFARKLTRVAKSSPVIQKGIENTTIVQFCRSYPALQNKIKFNAAGDKILLDTKISKSLFVKMLMDDFLTSELTKVHYESLAKDVADVRDERT